MVYILYIVLKKVFFRGNDDFRKSVSTVLKMLAAGFCKGKPHPQNSNTLEATKKKKKKTFTHKKVKCINKIKSI